MSRGRVLGVNACRTGWIGIALSGGDQPPGDLRPGDLRPGDLRPGDLRPGDLWPGDLPPGDPPRRDPPRGDARPYVAPTIRQLAELAVADGPLQVIAIDIPIGLADTGRRRADRLARQALGRRWPSLFITPVREAVEAGDFPAALTANRRLAGEGISRQAFALRAKILDVDEWLRGISPPSARVVEAHPELSFAQLAGAPLTVRKSTWAGAERRRTLLAQAGITLPGDLGLAGEQAGVDDVLDAAAAAWTARRVSQGMACRRPDPPETFSDGLPSAIWT